MSKMAKFKTKINGFSQMGHIWGEGNKIALLFLHGGPGNPNRHKIRDCLLGLSNDFLLCAYDQRGTGGSYAACTKDGDLGIDHLIDDVIGWARELKRSHGAKKVIVVGESFGSYIGSKAIQKSPADFHAYVGYGQLASTRKTFLWQYRKLEQKLDGEKLRLLHTIPLQGEPTDEQYDVFHSLLYPSFEPKDYPSYKEREIVPFNKSGEYGYFERRGFRKGAKRLSRIYGNLTGLTLEDDANYEIPYYVFAGTEDFITPFELSKNYLLNEVSAPKKEFVEFKGAGHMLAFDNPGKFIGEIERLFLDLLH